MDDYESVALLSIPVASVAATAVAAPSPEPKSRVAGVTRRLIGDGAAGALRVIHAPMLASMRLFGSCHWCTCLTSAEARAFRAPLTLEGLARVAGAYIRARQNPTRVY